MVNPFIIDDEYTIVYKDKCTTIDSIFWNGELVDIPKYFEHDEKLYMYCLQKCGLTQNKPDEEIYDAFIRLMYIERKGIDLNSIFMNTNKDDHYAIINYIYILC